MDPSLLDEVLEASRGHGRGPGSLVRRRGGDFFCFYRPGEIVSAATPAQAEIDGFVETLGLVAKATA